jgi:DNA-binding NarL/FixJ family response regulator
MQLGVRGYLPLSSCIESVVRAVRCIHNGGIAIAPAIAAKIALSLRSPTLTGREIEVLRMIMQGLPDKVIARHLQRSIATAKSHVKAILGKLGAASRAEAVAIARRRGLVPEEPRMALLDYAIPRHMPEFPVHS